MAKPIFADHATCSASSTRLLSSTASRRKRKSSFPTPSSTVLALLATISASLASAEASPAPPSFLCPSFRPEPTRTLNTRTRGTHPPSSPPVVKKSLIPIDPPRILPDKFVQVDSGRWRRVDTYTLYGSTVCISCQDEITSTSAAVFDDQVQNSPTSSVPISTSAASTSTYSISLPPGWKPQEASSTGRTTLILALSLVLASLICFFIVSCIFWRKKKRRGRGQADVEKKARKRWRRSGDEHGKSMLVEKEVKMKQKIWAKATARWKANAKYIARQRRGKRFGMTTRVSSPRSSCASLDRAEDIQTADAQPPLSTSLATISRRSSLESLYISTEATQSGDTGHTPSSPAQGDVSPQALPACPPSPPAYRGDNLAGISERDKVLPIPEPETISLHPTLQSSSYNSRGQSHPPYSLHTAHLATDDKRLLARMAELASAPPLDTTSSLDTFSICHASVPEWHDEELEDFGEQHESAHRNLSPSGLLPSPSSPANYFPSPPSKGKMAAPAFYDYPYTFDDMLVEPDPGPSAPPFEEELNNSSEMTELAPSAPPLTESEVAYYADTYPTPSQEWKDASNRQLSVMDGQIQSIIPSHDDGLSGSRSLVDDSNLPVQGPVASDGTPPRYHP